MSLSLFEIEEGTACIEIFDFEPDYSSIHSSILANPIHEPIEERFTCVNLFHFDELVWLVGLIDGAWAAHNCGTVSYTHLTLPTICSV